MCQALGRGFYRCDLFQAPNGAVGQTLLPPLTEKETGSERWGNFPRVTQVGERSSSLDSTSSLTWNPGLCAPRRMVLTRQGQGAFPSFTLRSPQARKIESWVWKPLNCMISAISSNFGILGFYHRWVRHGKRWTPTRRHGEEGKIQRQPEGAGSSRWYHNTPKVHRITVTCINT